MKYPKLAVCAFVLKTEWSTKTNSLAFVYAKDDSHPASQRETNTSRTASNIDAKKNGIRANTKVAEPSIESEEGISPTADGGMLSSSIIHDADMKGNRVSSIIDAKKNGIRAYLKVAEPSFESEEGISPTVDGGILSNRINHDAEMKGIRANSKVEVMMDETSPQESKAGTHGPLDHALDKKKTQINTDSKEAEQGIVETMADESFSSQGSKADAFGTEYGENQDDISSRAKIRALQTKSTRIPTTLKPSPSRKPNTKKPNPANNQKLSISCIDGIASKTSCKTCASECKSNGLNCCKGLGACAEFTGNLFNNSCNGKLACAGANIQTVKNGCIGEESCAEAGYDAGVESVTDSCNGKRACEGMAKHANMTKSCNAYGACFYQGVAGNMIDSCNGVFACNHMDTHADMTRSCNEYQACDRQGVAGNMIDSCNGERGRACQGMAEHANMTKSCNAYGACSKQGVAGNMIDSCNGVFACTDMDTHADMTRSCNEDQACDYQGVAGIMIDSCNGNRACYKMAKHANITGSCNATSSCSFQGVVTTDMLNCCNTERACANANRANETWCKYGSCNSVILLPGQSIIDNCTGQDPFGSPYAGCLILRTFPTLTDNCTATR